MNLSNEFNLAILIWVKQFPQHIFRTLSVLTLAMTDTNLCIYFLPIRKMRQNPLWSGLSGFQSEKDGFQSRNRSIYRLNTNLLEYFAWKELACTGIKVWGRQLKLYHNLLHKGGYTLIALKIIKQFSTALGEKFTDHFGPIFVILLSLSQKTVDICSCGLKPSTHFKPIAS